MSVLDVCRLVWLLVAALLIAAAGRPRPDPGGRDRRIAGAFLGASVVLVVAVRATVFAYDPVLNPDEALFAANALRASFGWLDWTVADPTTSGPLAGMVLTWPRLFGGDITLYSGRLTAAALTCLTIAGLFAAARRLAGLAGAMLATVPVVLFFGSALGPDFVHYSSETLPITLVAVALALLACGTTGAGGLSLAAAAVVLGAVPFAKPQAVPLAAAVGLFVLWAGAATAATMTDRVGRAAGLAAAALIPAAVILVPVGLAGGLDDAFRSAVLQQVLRAGPPGPSALAALLWRNPAVLALMIGTAILGLAAMVRLVLRDRPRTTSLQRRAALLLLVLAPATVLAIETPRRLSDHYLLLAVPALAVAAALAASVLLDRTAASVRRGLAVAALAIACAGPGLAGGRWQAAYLAAYRAGPGEVFLTAKPFEAPRALRWLRPAADEAIVCWGWRAECHVDNALPPATRDATSENQVYDTALQPYFRDRFMADFARRRPDIVVDVVSPGAFGFTDPARQGVASFPAFAAVLAEEFVLASRVVPPERCPRLYLRRDRLARLEASLVAVARVEGEAADPAHPAAAVDDRSVFEICDDHWLAPAGTPGVLTITFRAPSPVRRLALLGTRNGGAADRATERIRAVFLQGGRPVRTVELALAPFPWWTERTLDPPVPSSDAVRLEVLSFRGAGGGLNEVKLYVD
ncbi:hypothetical protein PQJ75_10115 [Rhodoplanes sp. TEM]|uniref:Glycosyltransferase RgtA/B/C/D-like domain-containing protein n=1 Tax=Rhodoplanes tepidamans TaxID=200616 RepID=A0ABT5J876_RHOTP|nr:MULTISPECIES: hypothetical protein [Rhodoplanes]MDC7785817.1 hypothetical protein [Rhodoplanes tepidamans]MDC7984084.1 hypothetical protein [Rhodoplanes sp. TEM]MDQ0354620.1 hypothetical protein [Rhodoplanes tepidamans]